ncbi:MAG TPA: tetratricopeptide repeat protein [Candidatus Paceibacterota bacterium]|nr:tetratricopeptide repeat protein [Verrucomicrobiota bacterium]HRY47826.1 tetratricopeptide repeat protein [Candidatus Paceibacterota bacterium]HSA00417.1 tetratricopeptide repeat protein [Candidatus Paceibacterota bacterium]
MDALEQLKEAAKNNHAASQFQLAVKYLEGVELQRDFDEAALWLRRSAEQGHAQAQIELGKLYVAGKGVEQDYVEAYKWVEMASIQRLMEIESLRKLKDADSCCEASRNELTLNNLSEFKRWMALRMTVDQITEGQQRAIQFLTMMRSQHGPDNPGESQQP